MFGANDVIENFHNYLDLLVKCGLTDDEEVIKYEPDMIEGAV